MSPLVDPGICEMISEMRARLLTSALDLRGFVVILLFGKAVGPTVVDTGYLGITGCMLKWASNWARPALSRRPRNEWL